MPLAVPNTSGTIPASNAITVHGRAEGSTPATAVDVYVQIEGSNWVMGNAILEQAREVHDLVRRAAQLGIPASAFGVEAMNVRTESGLFSKSTQATYDLVVRLDDMALLPAFLGAISDTRKATLQRLEWRYGDEAQAIESLLAEAAVRATGKARALAAALGIQLGPLLSADDSVTSQPWQPPAPQGFAVPAPARSSKAQATPDFGFAMGHRRRLEAAVVLRFGTGLQG
jgi:uncharacterized protein YggE